MNHLQMKSPLATAMLPQQQNPGLLQQNHGTGLAPPQQQGSGILPQQGSGLLRQQGSGLMPPKQQDSSSDEEPNPEEVRRFVNTFYWL